MGPTNIVVDNEEPSSQKFVTYWLHTKDSLTTRLRVTVLRLVVSRLRVLAMRAREVYARDARWEALSLRGHLGVIRR